jgi:hypothetical protein
VNMIRSSGQTCRLLPFESNSLDKVVMAYVRNKMMISYRFAETLI